MTLSGSEYAAWAARHAAMFSMTTERDQETFAAWYDVFAVCGYTAAELNAATLAIGQRPVNKWDQLAAIHEHVRGQRREGYATRRAELANRSADGEVGVCSLCGDTGYADVPHPKYLDPAHPFGFRATCLALCNCWKGRRALDGWSGTPDSAARMPMTLDQVTARVPGWRQLMLKLEDYRHAQAKAVSAIADEAGDAFRMRIKELIAKARGTWRPAKTAVPDDPPVNNDDLIPF